MSASRWEKMSPCQEPVSPFLSEAGRWHRGQLCVFGFATLCRTRAHCKGTPVRKEPQA